MLSQVKKEKDIFIQSELPKFSRVGFGTGSLHHVFSKQKRYKLIESAYDHGFTHFDTSPYYGDGLAEKSLRILAGRRRSDITMATKVGLYPKLGSSANAFEVWIRKALGKAIKGLNAPQVNWSIATAEKSFTQSLRRCKTDYFDVLYLHEPVIRNINTDEFENWLHGLKKDGKIRSWGVAGARESIEDWVSTGHPLTSIIQTRDSIDQKEADFLRKHGRSLQFTYGYFKNQQSEINDSFLQKIFDRNSEGTVLFSTRRIHRINSLAKAIENTGSK